VGASSYASSAALYKLAYDPIAGISPVTLITTGPFVVAVHPSVKAASIKELIALARAKPGSLTFGSSGTGGVPHLATEHFRQMTGINMTHVPYKGDAPAITDLLGGHVPMMFDNMPSALPHAKAGKLRGIAVSTAKRSPVTPDVPTVAESGLPGFEVSVWFAVLAPAGTPREIVERLNGVLVKALKSADVRERLSSQGAEPIGDTPAEFTAVMKRDLLKWAKVVKDADIKLD
jgi:tripartite-type tricarboxylate transporter receptor subunit TctC